MLRKSKTYVLGQIMTKSVRFFLTTALNPLKYLLLFHSDTWSDTQEAEEVGLESS